MSKVSSSETYEARFMRIFWPLFHLAAIVVILLIVLSHLDNEIAVSVAILFMLKDFAGWVGRE